MRDEDRSADGVSEIVLLVGSLWRSRIGTLFPRACIEEFVAQIFKGAAVECAGAGLGLDFDGAGPVAAVLRAVVGGEHLKFGDCFWVGIYVQRGVAAVVHVVAAIEFPVVVFGATAVHGVRDVAINSDLGIVLAGLAYDTWSEID